VRKYLFIAANEGNRWGGSEVLWSQAAERLKETGSEIRISAPVWSPPAPQLDRLAKIGCRVEYRKSPTLLSRLANRLTLLPEYHRDHLRSLGSGVDLVVISQGGNTDGLPWMEAARETGLRYVSIAQLASEVFWPNDGAVGRGATCYPQAVRAYFVSQANLNLTEKQFGVQLANGKVIRNPFGVPYDARTPWPDQQAAEIALACVARLDIPHKGQDLLLDVLALPHWRSRNLLLSFIGAGPNERGLRAIATERKLNSVRFAGELTDIETVWASHHALILASRYEGLPLSVVEAMLCARPCIVTDVGGNRELVRDEVNGFLAKAPTVALLDEALGRAWDNRDRLRAMGETAAADVRRWVSADPAADFARQLESLVTGPVSP
jgi:glycosyltransferase involved in cell wall biosynthesis